MFLVFFGVRFHRNLVLSTGLRLISLYIRHVSLELISIEAFGLKEAVHDTDTDNNQHEIPI